MAVTDQYRDGHFPVMTACAAVLNILFLGSLFYIFRKNCTTIFRKQKSGYSVEKYLSC